MKMLLKPRFSNERGVLCFVRAGLKEGKPCLQTQKLKFSNAFRGETLILKVDYNSVFASLRIQWIRVNCWAFN
jgi:hypothetical protein